MAVSTSTNHKKRRIKIRDNKTANFAGWYTSTAFSNSSGAIAEPYLPIFAQSLGASNGEIGLLAGLFSLINISQLIWAQLAIKYGNNKYFVFFGQLITALFFIPMAFLKLGFFILLLILRFFQGLFNSAGVPSLASLKSDYISDKERANKITKFTYLGLTGSFVGTLLGGQLFDYLKTITTTSESFSLLFLFTACVGIIGSVVFFFSVPNTAKLPINHDTITPESFINRDLSHQKSQISFTSKIRGYLKKFRPFWIFTVFGMIFYFGVYTVSPFFIIVEVDYFNFSFFQASILTAISIVFQVSVSIILVKKSLLDTYGRKPFLLLGVLFITFFTLLFAVPYYYMGSFSTEMVFYYCMAIWVVLGCSWGLFNSALAVLLLDIAHPGYRSLLIAVFNACSGIVMFLGPLTGGIIIDSTNDLFLPFILRFVILILGSLYLIKFITEPEISGIELKPIKNVFPFFTRMSSARGPELQIQYGKEKLARKKHL